MYEAYFIINQYPEGRRQILYTHWTTCQCTNVMPREKRWELWTAVSGLLALISRAYHNFSLWHHEFIKAAMHLWFSTNEIHLHKALLRLPEAQHLTNEIHPQKAFPLVCADPAQTFLVAPYHSCWSRSEPEHMRMQKREPRATLPN